LGGYPNYNRITRRGITRRSAPGQGHAPKDINAKKKGAIKIDGPLSRESTSGGPDGRRIISNHIPRDKAEARKPWVFKPG
jgi:hypothetical protein